MAKARALGRPARVRRPDPKAREREDGPIQYAETRARAAAERALHPTERLRQPLEQAAPLTAEQLRERYPHPTPAQRRRIVQAEHREEGGVDKRRTTRRARLNRGDAAGWGVPAEGQPGLLMRLLGRGEQSRQHAQMANQMSRGRSQRWKIRPGNRAERRRQARERGE